MNVDVPFIINHSTWASITYPNPILTLVTIIWPDSLVLSSYYYNINRKTNLEKKKKNVITKTMSLFFISSIIICSGLITLQSGVLVAVSADSQSSRVLVLERLDYAVLDLVLGHFAQRLQLRLRRLSQPSEQFDGLPVLGRPLPVAGPSRPFHLDDPRQRGRRRLVVRLSTDRRLLFAVDHHPGGSLWIARLTRLNSQIWPWWRRVRRKTRPKTWRIVNIAKGFFKRCYRWSFWKNVSEGRPLLPRASHTDRDETSWTILRLKILNL